MQVRIVLREKKTGRYYRDRDQWVSNAYDALTFQNILEAEEFCRHHALSDLQLIQQSGFFFRSLKYRPAPVATARGDSTVVSPAAMSC